jgi:hypothetical protein
MIHFKYCALFASIVIATISTQSLAQNAVETESSIMDQEAATLKFDRENSVVTQEMIENALTSVKERDELRDAEDLSTMRTSAISAEINMHESYKKLKVVEFLSKKIPPEILAAGEKETQRFIQENFLDNKNVSTPSGTVKTLWKSEENILTKPQVLVDTWETTITDAVRIENVTPEPVIATPMSVAQNTENVNQQESLNALGLTQEELEKMFGIESDNESPEEPVASSPDKMSSNVIISDIQVGRVVIMGKLKFINVDLKLNVVKGSQSKSIEKSFSEISPGYLFQIDSDRFELVSVDEKSVVFENIDTSITYRELLD